MGIPCKAYQVIILLAAFTALASAACQMEYGCNFVFGGCTCYRACKGETDYPTMDMCRKNAKRDYCEDNPCNLGRCLQKTRHPHFKCVCDGTGFYGPKCQHQCPKPGQQSGHMPIECIQI